MCESRKISKRKWNQSAEETCYCSSLAALLPMTRKRKTHKCRTAAAAAAVARIFLSYSHKKTGESCQTETKNARVCVLFVLFDCICMICCSFFWCVITNYKRLKNLSLPVCFFFSSFIKQKQKITIFFCEVKLFILTKLCFIIFRAVSQMETIIGKGG